MLNAVAKLMIAWQKYREHKKIKTIPLTLTSLEWLTVLNDVTVFNGSTLEPYAVRALFLYLNFSIGY
ncbi:hypothetical protein HMPREF9104_01523 [Lentilactobacillus kisonensis F0435]|uniref:Uncharacterized protein n=1 Tax=Lentilactobacillus kisonensis F0435 TaxID=797516 RepID=H1LFZ7_9LACO|nr:hypothetical protein HMPREF9104_01523 [Lentilactobacillus kisonensis F0435]